MSSIGESNHKKRKLPEGPELEIDVSAPEPPSKKALRKAKKKAAEAPSDENATTTDAKPTVAIDDKDTSKKRSEYGVWIGNLPFSVTRDDLRKFFTTNASFTDATITRVHMPKGAEKFGKSQNKGFAYVDFSTEKALKEALGLSEALLSGRRVLIKDANNYAGRPEKSAEDGQKAGAATGHPPSKRIFVGNLGFDATRELLVEHFSQCGTLAHVHLATFQDSGKCKGYGWVTFEDLSAAEAAVKGFIMVKEDDEEDEEEEQEGEAEGAATKPPKKAKKPRQRRVWVNNLLGRRMRMEFAEDATTRYKKRFGKEPESKRNDAEISEVAIEDASGEPAPRPRKPRQSKPEYSRYDEGTVQKLSGAIVEAQGKKISFD